MTYVIPSGFARVSFDYSGVAATGSRPSWGIGVAADPTISLTDAMYEWWDEYVKPSQGEGYVLERVQARNDTSVCETAIALAGDSNAAHQPPNVALLVKATSGAVGRANRGRIYLPGVLYDTDVNEQGQLTGAAIVTWQAAMNALAARLVVEDALPVILHSDVGAPTPVQSLTVQPVAATQRRRLRR